MADGLHEAVGDGGEDGKRAGDFTGSRVCPLVPNSGQAKGVFPVTCVDEVGFGEFFLAGPFDEGVGDNDAPAVADGLSEHGLLEDAHGTSVFRVVFFVVVAFGAGVDHVELLLGPTGGEAKLLHLDRSRGVARNHGGVFTVRDVRVGPPLRADVRRGLDLEARFNGLNGRDGYVAATHDGLNLLMTVGEKQGRFAIKWVGASNGARFHASRGDDAAVAVLVSDAVEGAVQFESLIGIVEKIHLKPALNEVAVAHADEADLDAAVVELFEECFHLGDEHVIGRSVRNAGLEGARVEVRVPDFDGDTGGEFASAAQLVGEVFRHGDEDTAEFFDIGGVLREGALG